MSLENTLTSLGVDYIGILEEISKNMHKAMFQNEHWEVLTVTGNSKYRKINQEVRPSEYITKMHDVLQTLLPEDAEILPGSLDSLPSAIVDDGIEIIKNGSQIILHKDSDEDWNIAVNTVEKSVENLGTTLKKDLLSWILYLKLKDQQGVLSCLKRIDTSFVNKVSENTAVLHKKIKSGQIKPCTL